MRRKGPAPATMAGMELVILSGLQASGKSTFAAERFAATHVHVSKDRLRNNPKPERRQHQLVAEALAAGRSVVVDNTNPTAEDRAALIAPSCATRPRQNSETILRLFRCCLCLSL